MKTRNGRKPVMNQRIKDRVLFCALVLMLICLVACGDESTKQTDEPVGTGDAAEHVETDITGTYYLVAQTMYGKCVDLRDTTKSSDLSLVIEKDGVGYMTALNEKMQIEWKLEGNKLIIKDEQSDLVDRTSLNLGDIEYKDEMIIFNADSTEQDKKYTSYFAREGTDLSGLNMVDIEEVFAQWEKDSDTEEGEGVLWSDVDWNQYKNDLSKTDYRSLKRFIPVLTGKKKVTYIRSFDKTSKEYDTFAEGAADQREELGADDIHVCGFRLVDLCGTGEKDILVDLHSIDSVRNWGIHIHEYGGKVYAEPYGDRWFYDVWQNGIYTRGRSTDDKQYYKMRFKYGFFVEDMLAEESQEYYSLDGEEVSKEKLDEWKKENCKHQVKRYLVRECD
ncbi:MAG: hypothetical protein VZQ83_08350 [Eubacterium sp.]|nr:hypothetical protein [Eubacterium sp.]